ncbi:hypothetical protein ACEWY4_005005 [Coilia grayii]|uniref:Calmin n=1 Tax=Coilia grayii TaxID=363190 RepID=A0ABD1KHF1_9TELE
MQEVVCVFYEGDRAELGRLELGKGPSGQPDLQDREACRAQATADATLLTGGTVGSEADTGVAWGPQAVIKPWRGETGSPSARPSRLKLPLMTVAHLCRFHVVFTRAEMQGPTPGATRLLGLHGASVERELVQKRTFTRWMNLHLEKCNPPLEVHDLFRDIQDGRILMALLEELSGCKLLHGFKPSSHRIFRLNNIAKVLSFLEERNVKLVSIDATDVADGNSSIVLGLIWNIILFFQIKELTGNIKSQFPSSSSLSSIPTSSDSDTSLASTPSEEHRGSLAARDHGKAIKTLLQWVQRRTRRFGVAVDDFGKSWTSGLAFLAVIKSIDPSLVDMRRALLRTPRENLEEAFRTAHYSLGIPRLLEPEDVTISPPDQQVIMTYVSQFLEHFPGMDEDDVSDVIDRSGSKVNVRLNDSVAHNGVKRAHETSYVVKRDWVKPPPKIFISSVADASSDQQAAPAPSLPSPKAWASEESSSSPVGDQPLTSSLDMTKDAPRCVSPSTPSSPQPSCVDSLISSPDSWSEVGMLQKVPESCSDGSLNETGLVCDTQGPVAHNKPQAPDKELCLDTGKLLDDGMESDLFIDEGNYSLCSLDSLQAKTPVLSEEEEASKHILSAQDDGRMPTLSGIANGSDTGTEEQLQSETVKGSSADLPDGGCESGYFPEDQESPPSPVEANSVSASPDQQIVNEIESKEESRHSDEAPEAADHLQRCIGEQTAAPEIISESDRMADRITDADQHAVGSGHSAAGNSILLSASESDTLSKDTLLLADTLEAQQEDIHYAENVDVDSVGDSDSCDGEIFSERLAHSPEAETIKGDVQQAKEREEEEKKPESASVEGEVHVRPDPCDDPDSTGVCEVPAASRKVPEQEDEDGDSGEMADGKVEDSGEADGNDAKSGQSPVEESSGRSQEVTREVDLGLDMIHKMDTSNSAEEDNHEGKSSLTQDHQASCREDISEASLIQDQQAPFREDISEASLTQDQQAPCREDISEASLIQDQQAPCREDISEASLIQDHQAPCREDISEASLTQDQQAPCREDISEASLTQDHQAPCREDISEASRRESSDGPLQWQPESCETARDLEDKEIAPECVPEDQLSCTVSKPEDDLTGTASLTASECDGTERGSDYSAGEMQSTSEDVVSGVECKTEDPLSAVMESLSAERQTGTARELRREPVSTKTEAEQDGVSLETPRGSMASTDTTQLEDENEDEEEDAEQEPVSVIPLDLVYYPHYDVPMAEVIDALGEPGGADAYGQAEGDGSLDPIGSGGAEDHGRLSLSVTPLQPAPVQERLPGPDTDSSDGEDNSDDLTRAQKHTLAPGDGLPQNMALEGPLDPQEPCASVPVEGCAESEWGAGRLDAAGAGGSDALIKSDGEWTGARENSTAVRDGVAVGDPSECSTAPYLRASAQPKESQLGRTAASSLLENGNKKSSEPNTPDKASLPNRRESGAERAEETAVELTLEEVCLLLLLWLVVYCLFVLPQMDLWTLPQLLFNVDD